MTPAQIEAAARELCRMRGIDPDDEIAPSCFVDGCRFHADAAKVEVERFAQVGTAIAAAMQPEKPPRRRKEKICL